VLAVDRRGRYHRDTVPTPTTEIRAMTVRWPATLHDQLRQVAERHDRSVNAEVRIAVREHLERIAGERRAQR
jgi:hypothetical protein